MVCRFFGGTLALTVLSAKWRGSSGAGVRSCLELTEIHPPAGLALTDVPVPSLSHHPYIPFTLNARSPIT